MGKVLEWEINKMYKIMICDDEKNTCAMLEKNIQQYAIRNGYTFDIEMFFSGDKLREYLKMGNQPDILFLDIELPGLDGIGVGKFIREELENEQICIVYISSKLSYAMDLFQNRPFDFLVKPLKTQKVFDVLNHIMKVIEKSKDYFEFQNKRSVIRILYNDILYFKSSGKKIEIVQKNSIQMFYGKLSEIEKQLPFQMFLSIHKSYLVHADYIEKYTYEWIEMINGDILHISKVNRPQVRKAILERTIWDI